MIAPWTARNVYPGRRRLAPIETTGFENIWYANHFVGPPRRSHEQLDAINEPAHPASSASSGAALRAARHRAQPVAARGEGRSKLLALPAPGGAAQPARAASARSSPGGTRSPSCSTIAFLALLIPPLLVFVFAGRAVAGAHADPARGSPTTSSWSSSSSRTRSPLPQPRSCPSRWRAAAGGVAGAADPAARRRPLVWIGLAARLLAGRRAPCPVRRRRGPRARGAPARCSPPWTPSTAATSRRPRRWPCTAAARAPLSPRPWLLYAGGCSRAGVCPRRSPPTSEPTSGPPVTARAAIARPRPPAPAARGRARRGSRRSRCGPRRSLSWRTDPWLVLEAAWRELPPPRTDEIRVGGDDYGAVRGFFHPRPAPQIGLEWARYAVTAARPLPAPSLDARPRLAAAVPRDSASEYRSRSRWARRSRHRSTRRGDR